MQLKLGRAETVVESVRRLVGQSPLRAPLRSLYVRLLKRDVVSARVAGERVRFFRSSAPQLVAPEGESPVAYADYVFTREFCRGIRPDDEVADVGSFAGAYALLAAALAKDGHITAFEPGRENRALLQRNLTLNRALAGRISVVEYAASDREGEAEFYSAGTSTTNSLFNQGQSDAAVSRYRVKTIGLDAFYARRGKLPKVVKIDVEGAELRVLRGAPEIVASGAAVFCEMHPDAWSAAGHGQVEIRAWLRENGVTAVDLRSGEPVAGDFTYGPYLLRHAGAIASPR